MTSRIITQIKIYRYYIAILVFYYFCFLLITPLGRFNPGVPPAHSYSLTTIDPWDDTFFYMKAKSLIVDGDLDYNNEYLDVRALSHLNERANPKMGAATQIGPSILFAPFVLFAHLAAQTANAVTGLHVSENGYSPLYLIITCIGSSLYAFLSLLIGFTILKKYFPPNIALLSILTVFMGNTIFYYTYVRMLMSHSAEAFTVAVVIFFYIKILERGELNDYLLFGLAYGLMGIVRYENAIIFVVLPLFNLIVSSWNAFRSQEIKLLTRRAKFYGLAAIAAAAFFSLQIIHFYIQSGHLLPQSLKEMGQTIYEKPFEMSELLLGEPRNITWGNPIIAIGVLGSLFFLRKNKLLGAGLVTVIFLSLGWLFWRPHDTWWGMDFGIRHLIKLSIPLAVGYAAIMDSVEVKGKTVIFGSISLLIMFWEYLKLLQSQVVGVLIPNFGKLTFEGIPDIVWHNFPSLLLGTESSYLRIIASYGFYLKHLNFNDWMYLVVIPLYVLSLGITFLLMFVYCQKTFYRNVRLQRAVIAIVIIFPLSLFTAGIFYPDRKPDMKFDEFRRAGILLFLTGNADQASWCLSQALGLKSDDKISKEALSMLAEHKQLPQVFLDPGTRKIISLVTNDSNPRMRSFDLSNRFYMDFGTWNARQFMGEGWDEGPYSDMGFPSYVWATGVHSDIRFSSGRMVNYAKLTFWAMSYIKGQEILIKVNGKEIGKVEMADGWNLYNIKFPPSSIQVGLNKLDFNFKAATKPSLNEPRKLAVAFDWLSIVDLEDATIDFGISADRSFLGMGWSKDEGPYPDIKFPTFVWGMGYQSEVNFCASGDREKVVTFRATTPFAPEQTITIQVNGKELETLTMRRGWNEYSFIMPASVLKAGNNKLRFLYEIAMPPAADGKDTRKLAVAFDWLKIEDRGTY